jgi:hypothetical protein
MTGWVVASGNVWWAGAMGRVMEEGRRESER